VRQQAICFGSAASSKHHELMMFFLCVGKIQNQTTK